MLLAGLSAVCALASDRAHSMLIDLSDDELIRRVPELGGVSFNHDEALARTALQPALAAVNETFEKFADVTAVEQISEMRLEHLGASLHSQRERFQYVARMSQGSLDVDEQRTSEKDKQAGEGGFLAGQRFFTLMETMLPEFAAQMRFRAVGRTDGVTVFAFAQIPGGTLDSGMVAHAGAAASEPVQGLLWIDERRGRPVRLRVEPELRQKDAGFDELRVELTFAEVRFDALDAVLTLPAQAVFDAWRGDVRMHAIHRFSEYRLLRRDPGKVGVYTAAAASRDAIELLSEGATAVDKGNASGALVPLREALRLDPTLGAAHFHLGRALWMTGDSTEAEREARNALNSMSSVYAVHTLLGVLLLKRGAIAEAVEEFRETVHLTPDDSTGHENLSLGLEAAGDRAGAIAEQSRAVQLAPKNELLKARLEKLSAAQAQTVLRVDVRQVLVPVVVTDGAGHHIGDLKQSDFRVLEDGVEQTITSFAVETSGESGVAVASERAESKAQTATGGVRHTYLIAIDTQHTEVESLHKVRESLQAFFAKEPAGDSQFGVMALGRSATILQNMTRDPAAGLAALDDKAFFRMLAGSRSAMYASEMQEYVRHLAEVRTAIDEGDRTGPVQARQLPREAERIAEEDRNNTALLLGELRDLVRQMAGGQGHRVLLLISGGFQLSPGRDAWELLHAYFPEMGEGSTDGLDRMQAEFESIVKLAARANVIIDTIDARGLYVPSSTDASVSGPGPNGQATSAMNSLQSEAGQSLAEFAAATGGIHFQNNNDLLAGIRKAVAAGRDYYTVGYVSSNGVMDGRFRNITVELRTRKATVRAKRGYWGTAQ